MALNRAQHFTVRKVASYFKVSYKNLLAGLDTDRLPRLVFSNLEESEIGFKDRYFCVEGKFHLANTLDPYKFPKTHLYQTLVDYRQLYTDSCLAYCVNANVLLVRDIDPGKLWEHIPRQWGGIIVYHERLNKDLMITPIKTDLSFRYPLPPT